MNIITLPFKLEMLLPTIQVFREYFNVKYPCTADENDGDNMPIEDEIKYMVYDFLLSIHQKFEDVSIQEYNKLLIKVSEIDTTIVNP